MNPSDPPAATAKRRGRPYKLSPAEIEVLTGLVRDSPLLSLDDLVWAFRQKAGIVVSTPTVSRYLRQAGFQRSRPARAAPAATILPGDGAPAAAPVAAKPYGYTAAHRDPGDAVRYPCGLTDSEWEQIQHLFDPPGRSGRPARYPRRQLLDACLYVLRSGCSWRMLPKDFPAWPVVYKTFRRWLARGLFEAMYDDLRQLWRSRQHRAPEPTAAILDSQSVKTSPQGGPKGYDAGKKVKGRKRHLVTDTLGLLLAVLVTTADTQDRDAALPVVAQAQAKVPGLQWLYVDGGYSGGCAQALRTQHQLNVEVVRHPGNRNVGRWHQGQLSLFDLPRGFVLLPKRWVIERTNAWNDRPRRMNKDHDHGLAVSSAWIWLTEARMLLRRLVTAESNATT